MGNIVSGKEVGKKFLSMKTYKKIIEEKLGFKPFAGTLNVKINPEKRLLFLSLLKEIRIESFEINEDLLGSISCFRARLNGVEGAVIVPEKTTHKEDILEFISEDNLRNRLNLRDGSEVMLLKNG